MWTMGSVRRMESWLSGPVSVSCAPRTAAPWAVLLLAVIASLAAPCSSNAQSVPSSERDGLVRLGVARGRSAEDIEALIRHADAAAAKGLPFVPLTSKIREGLAKGADPARIDLVVRQMAE